MIMSWLRCQEVEGRLVEAQLDRLLVKMVFQCLLVWNHWIFFTRRQQNQVFWAKTWPFQRPKWLSCLSPTRLYSKHSTTQNWKNETEKQSCNIKEWFPYVITVKHVGMSGKQTRGVRVIFNVCVCVCVCLVFQAPVLQASCLVKMAGVSLRGRAATSQMTVAMALMKGIVALPAPLRAVAVAGRALGRIILIGRWGRDLLKDYGLRMITRWWMKLVCDSPVSRESVVNSRFLIKRRAPYCSSLLFEFPSYNQTFWTGAPALVAGFV